MGGALKILIAEVQAALDGVLLEALQSAAAPAPGLNPANNPEQAAHAVLERVLQAAPAADGDPQELLLVQARLDSAIQSGAQSAIGIVSGWQDVAPGVAEAARAAAQLLANALGEEALNGIWLKPEWALFLPRLERFRRRRTRLRRLLVDPDIAAGELTDAARP